MLWLNVINPHHGHARRPGVNATSHVHRRNLKDDDEIDPERAKHIDQLLAKYRNEERTAPDAR